MQSTRDTPSVTQISGGTLPKSESQLPGPEDGHFKPAASDSPERTATPTERGSRPDMGPPADKMDSLHHVSVYDENRDSIIEAYTTDSASESSTEPGDLFENPWQPAVGHSQGSTTGEKLKVIGKRLDAGRPQYLIQCWMYAKRGGAANLYLDRCLQKYDARISQDLAEQGLL